MLFHYAKYFLFHFIGALALIAILAGGSYISFGLIAILVTYVLGDLLAGDDVSTPEFKQPGILTFQLWLALPLLSLVVFASIWSVSSGDVLGFGQSLSTITGYDLLAQREATSIVHSVSAFIIVGLMIGMMGTITAHELTHRTWDPISMSIGRWLLAFSFDTIFSIEHVYGHHRYVSTINDPATAPRGRNVYFHILASTIKGNISAWNLERDRLGKFGKGVLSFSNGVIRGHMMSVVLVILAYFIGGLVGALFFIACALFGKSLLEVVNFMEHYGMVRNPKVPVQPRHSWNTNKRISSWAMFNLTRHSHHHADGNVPYQDLRPYEDAPMMINGYLTTIFVALVPPLWNYFMVPKVLAWDAKYASKEELVLAKNANLISGNSAFVRAAEEPLYN
ncbi:MAG: alkane 1-monooxygenase [Oleispira sp.]|nr:alkane 1-monooxygenase [Oleispira sp.]